MTIRFFFFLLILMPYCAFAGITDTKVEKVLANETFSPHAIQISSGSLDVRGLYHLAVAVDSRNAVFLYFIGEAADGTAVVLDRVEVDSANSRASWSAEIKKKRVFISVHSSGGCCSHFGMKYQLGLNDKKKLVLIGYEVMDQGSNDGQLFREDKLKLNLITGDVIRSHAESKKIRLRTENAHFKPSWRMFNLLPPVKAKKRHFRVQVDKQWSLQNLSAYDEEFSNWRSSTIYGVNK